MKSSMRIFTVWNQRPPISRPDGFEANLVVVGEVVAMNGQEAIRIAVERRLSFAPIVQAQPR